MESAPYPLHFSVDYPDRPLNRLSTFFRLIIAVPILLVVGAITGYDSGDNSTIMGICGLVVLATGMMIVFRQKYPRWWFDWNLELQRFTNRVVAYLALMDDRYPSTDEYQSVHLDYAYPDVPKDLNRFMPLVKWFLAIPHYVVLFVLNITAALVVVLAWIAIMLTGRYPRWMFNFIEGVLRWNNRVIAYAGTLVTDKYPPFSLA